MRRVLQVIPWLVGAFLIAVIVHVVAVLILPQVATRDAYDRLAERGTSEHMVVLPASAPGDGLLPFRDPAAALAVCFFDLAKGSARVRAHVQEGSLLTLSFRTHDGRIFYAMTDRSAFHDTIDIRLLTDSQLADAEADDDEDRPQSPALRLKVPEAKGLVVARTLVTRDSDREDAEDRLKQIECGPEPAPTK